MKNLKARNVRIIWERRKGVSVSEIAAAFNISKSRIYEIIQSHKLELQIISSSSKWVVDHRQRCADMRDLWIRVANVDPFDFAPVVDPFNSYLPVHDFTKIKADQVDNNPTPNGH